jgi:hypothetical protein
VIETKNDFTLGEDLVGTSITAGPLLSLAVKVTSEQHVESVLRKIVEGLASQPGVGWFAFGYCRLSRSQMLGGEVHILKRR